MHKSVIIFDCLWDTHKLPYRVNTNQIDTRLGLDQVTNSQAEAYRRHKYEALYSLAGVYRKLFYSKVQ